MKEIIEFFRQLFSTESWPARWQCGVWSDFHGWLYILSDITIWLAYFTIPVILFIYYTKNKNPHFRKVFIFFSLFIFACGITHLLDAVIFWKPYYRLSALARFGTALISWVTVFVLIKITPRLLEYKSPEKLEREIEQRKQSEEELIRMKESLESMVRIRTEKLEQINEQLLHEIKTGEQNVQIIREEEEKFRSLVEGSPNAIILTNKAGDIQLINKQTELLFGYQRHELIDNTIEMLLPQEYRKKHPEYRTNFYHSPIQRPMGIGRDLFALHKNGRKIPVEIGLTPFQDKGELKVLSTIVDITARKKIEQNLKEKNIALENSNSELQQKTAQLIQSEKMSALGILVSGVAHELNNPLTGILNYTQYCQRKTKDNEKVHEVLTDILFEARRCTDIVNNLLAYVHRSEKDEVSETLNLQGILERILTLFKHLLETVNVKTSIAEDLPPFRINPNKLLQVLMNLIKNSIDAMEHSPKKQIEIEATFDRNNCYISISDTGEGVKSENLSKIFDPFYTTKEVGKGTGLGLSVSKSIIDECDGTIECSSSPEKGTRFTLTFKRT